MRKATRLFYFFGKYQKRSPTPRIRPHPRQDFSTWIKNRIAQYDFLENQDFVWVSENSETQRAVRLCGKQRLYLVPQKNGASGWWYAFVENQDYVRFTENSVKPKERYDFVENKAPQKNGAEKSMTYDNWQGRIEYFEKSIDKFKSILEND